MTTTAGSGGAHTTPGRDTGAATLLAALRSRAEDIRRAELARADGHWEDLSHDDRRRLEALTRAIVGALLREPAARLGTGAPAGFAHIESARFLFGLEVDA